MNLCYVVIPGAAKGERIAIVKLGESGYYVTDHDGYQTEAQCEEHVQLLNQRLRVPPEIADSMRYASVFGWHTPIALPALTHFANLQRSN